MPPEYSLVDPDVRFQKSFLEAADEFVAEGQHNHFAGLDVYPADDDFPGVAFSRNDLEEPSEFERFVAVLGSTPLPETRRPAGFVPHTNLWIVRRDEYVGRVSVRHTLTEPLLTWGGHIGYGVRRTARGRGAATFALGAVLPICADLGIDQALVTCDVDNEASRRTIERNGGVYEDTRAGKLRYWVPTGPA